MSVFGGESWAREAQYRKRRVDDLLTESLDASSFKKLPNGKYACLLCPRNPMHSKGSQHVAAVFRLKEKELNKRDEINKRIALSESCDCIDVSGSCRSAPKLHTKAKPLIKQTQTAMSEILCNQTQSNSINGKGPVKSSWDHNNGMDKASDFDKHSFSPGAGASGKVMMQNYLDFKEQRERELKFTAAGWKRDCHGRWFKDENVEFDSDEEDPNVCLG